MMISTKKRTCPHGQVLFDYGRYGEIVENLMVDYYTSMEEPKTMGRAFLE